MRTLIANPNEYRSTYLIQALNPPDKRSPFAGKVGPFDFGGGGSGLSQEAQKILCQHFSFDYMGAAEYEFGAVGQALSALYEFRTANLLEAKVVTVEGPIAERDKYQWLSRGKTKAKTSVYVLGCKSHMPKIEETIDSLINHTKIKHKYGDPSPVSLKRGIRLWESLFDPQQFWKNDGRRAFIGGLELDNGWMVFTDPEIFRSICVLFDVPVPSSLGAPIYIPPKALLRTEDADKKILKLLELGNPPRDFCEITNLLYDLNYKMGDVVAPEHYGYCEQVTKRLAVLARKKLISRDRKTKTYTKRNP